MAKTKKVYKGSGLISGLSKLISKKIGFGQKHVLPPSPTRKSGNDTNTGMIINPMKSGKPNLMFVENNANNYRNASSVGSNVQTNESESYLDFSTNESESSTNAHNNTNFSYKNELNNGSNNGSNNENNGSNNITTQSTDVLYDMKNKLLKQIIDLSSEFNNHKIAMNIYNSNIHDLKELEKKTPSKRINDKIAQIKADIYTYKQKIEQIKKDIQTKKNLEKQLDKINKKLNSLDNKYKDLIYGTNIYIENDQENDQENNNSINKKIRNTIVNTLLTNANNNNNTKTKTKLHYLQQKITKELDEYKLYIKQLDILKDQPRSLETYKEIDNLRKKIREIIKTKYYAQMLKRINVRIGETDKEYSDRRKKLEAIEHEVRTNMELLREEKLNFDMKPKNIIKQYPSASASASTKNYFPDFNSVAKFGNERPKNSVYELEDYSPEDLKKLLDETQKYVMELKREKQALYHILLNSDNLFDENVGKYRILINNLSEGEFRSKFIESLLTSEMQNTQLSISNRANAAKIALDIPFNEINTEILNLELHKIDLLFKDKNIKELKQMRQKLIADNENIKKTYNKNDEYNFNKQNLILYKQNTQKILFIDKLLAIKKSHDSSSELKAYYNNQHDYYLGKFNEGSSTNTITVDYKQKYYLMEGLANFFKFKSDNFGKVDSLAQKRILQINKLYTNYEEAQVFYLLDKAIHLSTSQQELINYIKNKYKNKTPNLAAIKTKLLTLLDTYGLVTKSDEDLKNNTALVFPDFSKGSSLV
jgi:hypothetical protein